jgi:hypothetical protein
MKVKPKKAKRLRQPNDQARRLIDLVNAARHAEDQTDTRDRLVEFLGETFTDGDRIRVCLRCGQIFFAGRLDMAVCATCAPAWRTAQHRARKGRNTIKGAE